MFVWRYYLDIFMRRGEREGQTETKIGTEIIREGETQRFETISMRYLRLSADFLKFTVV